MKECVLDIPEKQKPDSAYNPKQRRENELNRLEDQKHHGKHRECPQNPSYVPLAVFPRGLIKDERGSKSLGNRAKMRNQNGDQFFSE